MPSDNKKFQRITVLVIIGAVVMSLALSLLSGAGALGLTSRPTSAVAATAGGPGVDAASDPSSALTARSGSAADQVPMTRTPQGPATQVIDTEHSGGLLAFAAVMLGGLALLLSARRRTPREERPGAILS